MTAPLLVLGGLFMIIVLTVLINSMIWLKTWITINQSAIIIERNTMNKVCNTIGMKNISNVNIEQNIMERNLGTCKIKLDTNSLSTADSTDVIIVLKKTKALDIPKMILERVNEVQGQKEAQTKCQSNHDNKLYDMISNNKDIVLHGICSINIISFFVLLGCIGGSLTAFTAFKDSITENWVTLLANLVVIAFGILISVLDYYTSGSYWDEKQILIANGYFQRKITVMIYDKIQYLEINTNLVLYHWGLVHGNANQLVKALVRCDNG